MSHRCPVCRTKLWTDGLFITSRVRCPRCGTEFRATVSWAYFRLLLLLCVLAILIVVLWLGGDLLILLALLALTIFFWYLPRLIDLQHIPEPTPSEGLFPNELEPEDLDWEETRNRNNRDRGIRALIYFILALVIFLLIAFTLKQGL